MLITQVLFTFEAIRQFPGQDLDGLAEKIYELGGDIDAVRFLIYGDYKYTTLPSRIRELNCIIESNGRYYFDPKIKPYSKDPILNSFISNILKKSFNS